MDRRRPSDGAVSLLVTVNQRRGLEDYRAIAITFCKILVDPLRATQDLRDIGASLKSAVRAAKRKSEPILKLFPIVPWMPRSTTAALVDRVFTYADDLPVSCSNLGTLPARVGCIVESYRLDADISAEHLRDILQRTLSELGLEGLVEC